MFEEPWMKLETLVWLEEFILDQSQLWKNNIQSSRPFL